MIGKVKVKMEMDNSTHVYVDDEEIHRVRSIEYKQSVDEAPSFKIEILKFPEIEVIGDVEFDFTPQTVQEAMRIVRHALLNDEDFMVGFLSSIESSINDQELTSKIPFEDTLSIASKIMNRIIGEADGNSEDNIGDC